MFTNVKINKEKELELEREIKLHINQRLYDQGMITENMYTHAKKLIYVYCNS